MNTFHGIPVTVAPNLCRWRFVGTHTFARRDWRQVFSGRRRKLMPKYLRRFTAVVYDPCRGRAYRLGSGIHACPCFVARIWMDLR